MLPTTEPNESKATPLPTASSEVPLGVAVTTEPGKSGTVTARKAGGLRDMGLEVDPKKVGVNAALQHLAKAVNIAFQTDYGENYLESVYQAAIVRRGRSRSSTASISASATPGSASSAGCSARSSSRSKGPTPPRPRDKRRSRRKGPRTIRGILNLIGRKLDLVAEYEDRVPAYVEQMFDRLEASGIIVGWNRDNWDIWTTNIGLDIRIAPKIHGPAGVSQDRRTA